MEASDTSGQPPQEPGQTDATGQEQPSQDAQSEQPASSQEQPTQDSQLQTPQADQPVPSEAERQDAQPVQDSAPEQPSPSEYQPSRLPLENAGLDQEAAEADRQAELDREREEHNQRTAGEQPEGDPLTSASDSPQDEA